MGKKVDVTGQRYGKLIAICPTEDRTKSGGIVWLFKCDCGNKKKVSLNSVRSGLVKSCGCLATPHHLTGTRLFNIWVDMKQRCYNSKYPQYRLWGGRGIVVCDEWFDFKEFNRWALSNGYTSTLTLDRIDVNGNYCPQNCRWATYEEQARNTRRNKYIEINGNKKLVKDWCEEYDISPASVYRRIRELGMTYEQAITTPRLRRRGSERQS